MGMTGPRGVGAPSESGTTEGGDCRIGYTVGAGDVEQVRAPRYYCQGAVLS